MSTGVWYLHAANDSAAPALVADRVIGISQEQTYVDSARVVIDPNGSYQQRVWIRILIGGSLDREEVFVDDGFWTSFGDDNAFRSFVRDRSLVMRFPAPDRIESTEELLFWSNAPLVRGTYRRTRP